MQTAYFTICAKNYLAHAVTLRESLEACDPNAKLIIFLCDEPSFETSKLDDVIPVDDVTIPAFEKMQFRYTVMELSTAVKPFCFLHLFNELNFDRVVYLDPDIKIYRKMRELNEIFDTGAQAIVTPHRLKPAQTGQIPDDIHILRTGTQNLGFLALKKCDDTERFVKWWASHLEENCVVNFSEGFFVDQKFVEFLPSFVANTHILRDLTYNVAYWNIDHRPLTKTESGFEVLETPLAFFHFSGAPPHNRGSLSKHRPQYLVEENSPIEELLSDYQNSLASNGIHEWSKLEYAFDAFVGDERIPPIIRRAGISETLKNDPSAFWAHWNAPSENVDQTSSMAFTRLMLELYDARPDLKEKYALSHSSGRRGYHDWFLRYAKSECSLPQICIDAAQPNRRAAHHLYRFIRRIRAKLAR